MNSKLWNRKLTSWRSMNDEERTKNNKEWWRTFTEWITKTSQKHYGITSAWIFSFFLILLTNFKWILNTQGVEPFILNPPPLFIAKIGEVLTAQLAKASWLLPDEAFWWAQCWRTPPSLISSPIFFVFCLFPSETSWNFTDHAVISVKHLNLVSQSSYVDEQLSLDEIRVWQLFSFHSSKVEASQTQIYLIILFYETWLKTSNLGSEILDDSMQLKMIPLFFRK